MTPLCTHFDWPTCIAYIICNGIGVASLICWFIALDIIVQLNQIGVYWRYMGFQVDRMILPVDLSFPFIFISSYFWLVYVKWKCLFLYINGGEKPEFLSEIKVIFYIQITSHCHDVTVHTLLIWLISVLPLASLYWYVASRRSEETTIRVACEWPYVVNL